MIGLRRRNRAHGQLNTPPLETVRIIRPTSDLDRIVRFYVGGLGLELREGTVLDRSRGGRVGLPGGQLELSFVQVCRAHAPPPPEHDPLGIVLHVRGERARDRIVDRVRRSGFPLLRVDPPAWLEHGIAFEDPDGWVVVVTATS